jgi:hypothetical protein
MLNSLKKWALVAAVLLGGTMFQLGCGGNQLWLWTAILNEDLFG